jgi:hypothetical protein
MIPFAGSPLVIGGFSFAPQAFCSSSAPWAGFPGRQRPIHRNRRAGHAEAVQRGQSSWSTRTRQEGSAPRRPSNSPGLLDGNLAPDGLSRPGFSPPLDGLPCAMSPIACGGQPAAQALDFGRATAWGLWVSDEARWGLCRRGSVDVCVVWLEAEDLEDDAGGGVDGAGKSPDLA